MQELRRLIDQYGERYSTAIIYVIFAAVSLLVAAILFGILHSTGVMKLVLAGAVQEAEFGGAFAGFLITLILLIRYYNIVQKETKLVITGNVLLTDGNPVQGALIFVEGVDRQKLTDTTGWFTIEVDKQDSWTVRASYEGKNAKETIRRKDIRKPIRLELHQELEVLERASSPVPAAESESKPPPDTTGNLQAQLPSEEQLVAEVVSRDPLLANPAAGILQQRPDLISNIVDKYPSTPIAEAAVKSILRLYPQLSSKALMERLAKAGPGKGWHLARTSTFYFDAVHAPYCGNALGKNLKSFNAELCQLSIEALGRCGHSGWGYQLRSLLAGDDDYYLEKYGSYVVEALARHFVRSVTEVGMQIFGPSQKLRDELIHLHDKRSGSISYSTLRQILGECNGRHADALIRDWLTSEYSTVVKLAADVLGGCRIVRGVKPLMEVMERWSETTVVRSCSSAIGNIATSEAIHQLLAPGPNIERGYGLVFALEKIDDMPTFRQAVVKLIDTKSELNYFVLRAIGQKRAEEFMKFLLSAFEGSEPIERGIAALALARLEQAKKIQKDKFLLAYKQAADTIERIFTALAVLTVEPTVFAELESQLREDLGKESYLYWPALQTDILDVLLKSGDSRAIELANAWRPFYQRAYLERIST